MKTNNQGTLADVFGKEKRWVNWHYVDKSGKQTKVPITTKGHAASTTNPATWSTYDEVLASGKNIGIVFTPDQKLLGIDIDHVLEDGAIRHEKAAEIVELITKADTYTEISPSRTGLHLLLALTEPLKLEANRKAPFECYTSGRYFTVTQAWYAEFKRVRTVTPEEALSLLAIIGYPWGNQDSGTTLVPIVGATPPTSSPQVDAAILQEMFHSKHGAKLISLYAGDISNYDGDESRADMALCAHLAYWTRKDAVQMERIWLASGLGKRAKTQRRKDYRARTISKAIEDCKDVHSDTPPATVAEQFDLSTFKPATVKDLVAVLGLTIKRDEHNKVTALFCELSAYTEGAQFNISFSAPSSTGKSFIPMEVAKLFPQEDVIMLAYSSPTAFFHDSKYDPESGMYVVDLERKIIIFMDQPHYQLLEKLRPLLSHDRKEILLKITDKNMKGGHKTKNIIIRGYPSVVFCTADMELNDQEATRLLLLSPEISQEKIREGILSTIRKEADGAAYEAWLEQDPGRALLKSRIRAIKAEKIDDVNIRPELASAIESVFIGGSKLLKPRYQRDAKKLMSLVKAHALLNVWHRERIDSIIFANSEDVEAAVRLWETISVSQELNLPPYLYEFYKEVIVPAWAKKKESIEGEFPDKEGRIGLTRHEILAEHRRVTGRLLNPNEMREKMLPMLETAGLITQERSPDLGQDQRNRLVYLVSPENVLGAIAEATNSAGSLGVETNDSQSREDDLDLF